MNPDGRPTSRKYVQRMVWWMLKLIDTRFPRRSACSGVKPSSLCTTRSARCRWTIVLQMRKGLAFENWSSKDIVISRTLSHGITSWRLLLQENPWKGRKFERRLASYLLGIDSRDRLSESKRGGLRSYISWPPAGVWNREKRRLLRKLR